MDLKQLRIFLTAAKHLHFTLAAEQLSIAQPAVSKAIVDLEQELRVPLFNRSTRAVRLTKAGEVFSTEVARVMDQLDRAVELARRADTQSIDTLRVGYSEFSINGHLSEVMRIVRNRHPEIKVELTFMSTLEQRAALLSGKIDIGFMQGVFDHPGYVNHFFQRDILFVITAVDHPLARHKEVKLADLADESFVFGEPKIWRTFREAVFNSCRVRGLDPTVVQEATTYAGVIGLVAAGIGISIFATLSGRLPHRDVASIAIKDKIDPLSTFLVFAEDDRLPSLQKFVAIARAHGDQTSKLDADAAPRAVGRANARAPVDEFADHGAAQPPVRELRLAAVQDRAHRNADSQ